MRLSQTERVGPVPGHPELHKHTVREWVCRECDYFEEAEEETT
jgi:hypothetical protein